MNKLLTKNLLISILVGISIVGGAFWLRTDDKPTINISKESNGMSVAKENSGQIEDTLGSQSSDNDTIRVADLPNVNGLMFKGLSENQIASAISNLSTEELTAIEFLNTSNGSTLAYDEIKNKSVLYQDGPEKYEKKDIKSVVDTNRASLLVYARDIAKILKSYPFYSKNNPIEITLDTYNKKGGSAVNLPELEVMRISYETASKKLLDIDTPSNLTDLHLRLTNNIDRTAQLISNMKEISSDQLLALNSARHYVEEVYFTISTLTELSKYLEDMNITLEESDKLALSIDIIN